MTKKNLTNQQKQEIVEKFKQGVPANELATEYGIDFSGVYRYLRKAGIKRINYIGKLTNDKVAELKAKYLEGISASSLELEYGIPQESIYQMMHRAGITRRDIPDRQCSDCGVIAAASSFPMYKDGFRSTRCQECYELYKKLKDSSHSVKRSAKKRGISVEEYNKLFSEQSGHCAICNRPDPKGRLAIDHDHTTGKVRGLLCRKHNLGLGSFEDSIEHLRAAIAYLQEKQ